MLHRLCLCALLLVTLACNASPTGPTLGEADLRMIFVGNSLTYTNDTPALLETIAAAQGISIETVMMAAPNFSLEDHWNQGAAGTIQSLEADVVVMQQGPSSLPQNQVYLREWAQRFDEPIRASGAKPALMMVWPERTRIGAFPAVRDSYLWAAEAIGGDFIPVGEVVRRLLAIPGIEPLGIDGFHPSLVGSVAAAMTILRCYFPDALEGMPSSFPAPAQSGLPSLELDPSTLETILKVVEEIATEWGC